MKLRFLCTTGLAITSAPLLAQQTTGSNSWKPVDAALGRSGQIQPGDVYKFAMPRKDLEVTKDGVIIAPGLALGSWAAFKEMGNETMLMCDLVLTEDEIEPVMLKLHQEGIEQTSIYNHLLGEKPHTIYMHVAGHGDAVKLATSLAAALALTKTPGGSSPRTSNLAEAPAPTTEAPAAVPKPIDLDTKGVEQALGFSGRVNGGILQFGIPRKEKITDRGMEIPPSMGTATAINFQPTGGGKAAISGDFVLLANEVNPVIRALRNKMTPAQRKQRMECDLRGFNTACRSAAVLCFAAAVAFAQSPGPVDKLLTKVADVPMPGPAVRFDYQTFDPSSGRLYIAHMNADQLVVFDTSKREVIANLDGFKHVHGVTLAPEIHRLYAAATGAHQVTVVDTGTLKIVGTAGPITYPDGLAFAPKQNKIFVSDERGAVDAVIDARTNKLITNIPLGGGAGNTVYDSVSGNILVAVHEVNLLAVIDPETNQIISRLPLAGMKNPHGIALDMNAHVAFVAGEENHSLAMVDLNTMKVLSTYQVGEVPDVLAFDPGLKRLYVSAESGTVTIFQSSGKSLSSIGSFNMPHAHTVSVDPKTHFVYFPLENVNGHPLLRIMRPVDQGSSE